jgi:trk system potassium uptake protein TrkH
LPAYGWQTAAKWGVFHAVSAFCNAGFDIFGEIAPGMSLVPFNRDPVVCITLMVLITLGGLGFFVWEELIRVRRWDRLSVYTRLVLLTGLCLTVAGAVVFMILEWDNPGTLGSMEPGDKVLNAFFQSVTLRTAGFAGIDQGALTDAGKAAGMVLMLIGGASGSTAGGMKTVTFIVLILFLVSRLRGKSSVTVFRKRILPEKVLDAMTIFGIMVGLALFGGIFICATSPIGFADSLYESVSALATVGVTANVTSLVSVPGRLLLVLFMYFGRVGVLTLSLGFLAGNRASDRFQYAHTNLFIG